MSNPSNIILPQYGHGHHEGNVDWNREAVGGIEGEHAMSLDTALKLHVDEGGIVEATFPFQGDAAGSQLSFEIGDTIQVLQKDELWSWGKLMRTGEEGYFPHNYVQGTFKPLPGMHELQLKMAIKKAREEAVAKGEDPDVAEAILLSSNSQDQSNQQTSESHFDKAQTLSEENSSQNMPQYNSNLNDMFGYSGHNTGMPSNVSMYDTSFNMQQHQGYDPSQAQTGYSQPNDFNAMNNGGYTGYGNNMYGDQYAMGQNNNQQIGYGNTNGGQDPYGGIDNSKTNAWNNASDVDMAFGMWVDYIDGGHKPILPQPKIEREKSSPSETGPGRRDKRRQKLIKELLSSEESYVGALEALLDTIIRPCLGDGPGVNPRYPPISHSESERTFGGLKTGDLLKVNRQIRNELRSRVKQLDENSCIGDLFSKFSPSLRAYVDYCLHHESAMSQVSFLARSNDSFRSLLKRSKADSRTNKRDVQELMNLPKQRLPEYKASLIRIQQFTDESHADHMLLQKAIDEISDIINFIEEGGQWRVNQGRMASVRSKLIDCPHDLCRQGRIFLRDGVLKRLGKYFDRDDYFVLFNDGLLQARPQKFKNKYQFKRIVNVLRVELVPGIPGKKAHYLFRVVADGHIFLLNAMSADHRTAWMKALTQVIKCGTRQLLHKGPLGLLKLEKDPVEVREEFFYVFSDVVVRGKTLWRDKFKHMQTLDVTRIEETYMPGQHYTYGNVNLPPSLGHSALDLCFRIIHIEGTMVLMAPSQSEKNQWIKALSKQQECKRDDAVKGISARNTSTQDIYGYGSDSDGNSVVSKSSNVSRSADDRRGSVSSRSSKKKPATKSEPEKDLLDLSDDFTNPEPSPARSISRSPIIHNDLLTNQSNAATSVTQPVSYGTSSSLLTSDLAQLYATPSANVAPQFQTQMRQQSFMQGQQHLQGNNMGAPVYNMPNHVPQTSQNNMYSTQPQPYNSFMPQYQQPMPQGQNGYVSQQQVYSTQQQPGYYPPSQGW